MIVRDVKRIASGIFMFGFLAGIIYVNVFAKAYVVSMGIFSDYFLEQYSVNDVELANYLIYIMKIRLVPLVVLVIAGCCRYRKIVSALFLLWTGFLGGIVFTTAVFKLGLKGIGLCIVGVMPHFICYIAVYAILLTYLLLYPDTKWNSMKTMSMAVFMMLGIITECYINPVILEIYMNLL